MALENVTDQIKEKFAELTAKIQESPLYNSLRERFETLTPAAQRGIVAGAAALVVLLLISYPYSDFSASSQNVEAYNENRALLRQLFAREPLSQ
jgi:hypothetical protein